MAAVLRALQAIERRNWPAARAHLRPAMKYEHAFAPPLPTYLDAGIALGEGSGAEAVAGVQKVIDARARASQFSLSPGTRGPRAGGGTRR